MITRSSKWRQPSVERFAASIGVSWEMQAPVTQGDRAERNKQGPVGKGRVGWAGGAGRGTGKYAMWSGRTRTGLLSLWDDQ